MTRNFGPPWELYPSQGHPLEICGIKVEEPDLDLLDKEHWLGKPPRESRESKIMRMRLRGMSYTDIYKKTGLKRGVPQHCVAKGMWKLRRAMILRDLDSDPDAQIKAALLPLDYLIKPQLANSLIEAGYERLGDLCWQSTISLDKYPRVGRHVLNKVEELMKRFSLPYQT
jgi:hypothetical protein